MDVSIKLGLSTPAVTVLCRCTLTVLVNGQGQIVKDEATVVVSRPPADIHMEVDGQVKTSEIIKFSESKSRKVNRSCTKCTRSNSAIASMPSIVWSMESLQIPV